MRPILDIALLGWRSQVASYGLLLTLAAVATVASGLALATRRGLAPGKTGVCLLGMAVAVPVGARLLDAATRRELYALEPQRLLQLDFQGFSLFGGGLLALLVGALVCHLLSLDPIRLADSVAPALGLGIALARVGCFLAGCCFGVATSLPWGVTFPFGSEAHLYQLATGAVQIGRGPLPVHPTQLYELAVALGGAVLSSWLLARKVPDGTAFAAFVLWYAAFRWMNEQLRAPSLTLGVPGWFYPLLYTAIMAVAGSYLLFRRASRYRSRRSAELG